MESIFVFLVCLAAFYGFIFFALRKTNISNEEIVIERMGLTPFSSITYTQNLQTGEERVHIFSPFGKSMFIKYDGAQKRIWSVHHVFKRSLFLKDDGNVSVWRGETIRETVPYEDVKEEFDEALVILCNIRERFARFLPDTPTVV